MMNIDQLDVKPSTEEGSHFSIKGRIWVNQTIAVPYLTPLGSFLDIPIAFDLIPKGNPNDVPGAGVAWLDICDTNEQRLLNNDLELLRVGKYKNGIGYISTIGGTGPGNMMRTLVLQHLGGDTQVGITGAKVGFFGKAPIQQQKKADHNNWATMADILSALANLGLIDAV
jgi:hypothetical protein